MNALRQLLYRLPFRLMGTRMDRELKMTNARRAQFVSFLESSGYRTQHVDRYELALRRRRFVKTTFMWATAFGVAWVAIESAKALTIF